jgi:hypothetical protein
MQQQHGGKIATGAHGRTRRCRRVRSWNSKETSCEQTHAAVSDESYVRVRVVALLACLRRGLRVAVPTAQGWPAAQRRAVIRSPTLSALPPHAHCCPTYHVLSRPCRCLCVPHCSLPCAVLYAVSGHVVRFGRCAALRATTETAHTTTHRQTSNSNTHKRKKRKKKQVDCVVATRNDKVTRGERESFKRGRRWECRPRLA